MGLHGCGTIIDKDGTNLTCANTLRSFPGLSIIKQKIGVTLEDGRTFEGRVEIANLELDVAIVKIKYKTPFPCAKLGTSAKLRPGDLVITIGCPLYL
ncbi:unnamed protein product [Cuscuta campestris]|uniref:Protease Do-like PDZ domain-containing protein n=1 Tax=Cuscuta campestris TaxID=132261 RepID=A0A484NK11_9ASTE|nr:unnamed protein product [Cuscuta campestris]